MRYWYAYTGEHIILGHGRAIRSVLDVKLVQRLLARAEKLYADYPTGHRNNIPKDMIVATLVAPLAAQEMDASSIPAMLFSSAGQILHLFADVDIDQAAVNLFNGRIASVYADEEAVASSVARGFDEGQLLLLPRDTERLHTQEVLNTLPGAVVFLLSRQQAQRKMFDLYLRRGTPPVMSDAGSVAIAALRPTFRTWEWEARITRELLAKGCACISHL